MIRRLRIQNFKSISKADIRLGPLNFLIGPNAGGKSNVLDAIRALQGFANGYNVREVLDGRLEEATLRKWNGIRGGAKYAKYQPNLMDHEVRPAVPSVELEVEVSSPGLEFRWWLSFEPQSGRVIGERLEDLSTSRPIYDTHPDDEPLSRETTGPTIQARVYKGKGGGGGNPPIHDFSSLQPILTQLKGKRAVKDANEEFANRCTLELTDIQFLDPQPAILRQYSVPGAPRMGDRGDYFASVIHGITKDEKNKKSFLSWLQELTPAKITDLHFFRTDLGEVMFGVREEAAKEPIPALSLSDGTLRFTAIVAALFQPAPPRTLLVEEMENGIHAPRMRLLVEMVRRRSREARPQVIATTHSPLVLAYLPEDLYKQVVWVARREGQGPTEVMPVTEMPNFASVIRRQPLNELFSHGWLEAAF